jgi:hypothetical protein
MKRRIAAALLVISSTAAAEDWDDKVHKCYIEAFASLVATPLERRMVRPDVAWEQYAGVLTCSFYLHMMTCSEMVCRQDVRACERTGKLRRDVPPLCQSLLPSWDAWRDGERRRDTQPR